MSEPKKEETRTLAEILDEKKPTARREGETFIEWCDRLKFDPRCTCDFGLGLAVKDQ